MPILRQARSRSRSIPFIPASKWDDYSWQNALCAFQGGYVVTDTQSPFRWVGTVNATVCIIHLLHGITRNGGAVAACIHGDVISQQAMQQVVSSMRCAELTSVNLISACTPETDERAVEAVNFYRAQGCSIIRTSFGKAIQDAAIDVQTGDVVSSPVLAAPQPKGFLDEKVPLPRERLMLNNDGRNLRDIEALKSQMDQAVAEVKSTGKLPYGFFHGPITHIFDWDNRSRATFRRR